MRLDEQIRTRLAKRPTVFPGMSSDMREYYRERFDQMADALLAVLDLHKPARLSCCGTGTATCTRHEARWSCDHCDTGDPYCTVSNEWPCPTVVGIAAQLGIEVADA